MPFHEFVYVVDDDAAVCDALQELMIEAGYRVKTFLSGSQFLLEYDSSDCACLVVDLRMPMMNGLELQERIRHHSPPTPCVFLSGHGDIPATVKAMKNGAVTFLEKPCKPTDLLNAVREGVAAAQRQGQLARSEATCEGLMERLTDSERNVLNAMTRGLSNPQIASQFDISLRTVQFRRTSLMKKLGVKTRAELIALTSSAQAAPFAMDSHNSR